MEGVPFIISRDNQLIMKAPSETLIKSKEMPQSEKTQLLALAKSQIEKDHQAGKKRIPKKDEVGSLSKKMKFAKK
ncbi:hypothetical protein CTI12_AA249740 [Artemisia annua]|uniref:Uncharacterized protein n=1 Tax=Artemisia annua TaxID=35608 RepID=A0A2U1NM05_ARTAN|nr:hypothetical protein CTI12_AA249740 [Artemisia annua]